MKRRRFVGLAGAGALGLGHPLLVLDDDRADPSLDPSPATAGDRPGPIPQADPRFEEVARLIEAKMAEYRTTGVAFGLSKNGAVQARGFGITNVDNPQPVTADTVFPIASISKTAVGTAMMRLRDQGRVDVEAPVLEYVPDLRVADAAATREVRVWHLLTHTPGWEGQLGTPDRGPETLANFIGTLRDLPQLARPGEVWSYNNAGWGVAGRVIEVVTESTINEALDDLVFDPLGLERAFSRTGEAMTYRFAAPHRERDGRTTVIRSFQLPANVAAGGCAMSVENLIRYARFHIGDGTGPGGERLLSADSLLAMRTARVPKNSSTDEMGLGWHLRALDGVLTAQHGGTLGGHCLHVQLVPERDLCFAILTNHQDGWRLNEDVAAAILDAYEGLALAPGQRTGGNRGGNERMTSHAEPLAPQPAPGEYVGLYERPPVGEVAVSARDGGLAVGSGDDGYGLVFWAPDMAYSTGPGAFEGMAVEFIRDGEGTVTWVRVNGRIARKAGR
jgi:CubicO group peptidase (beta-lactamase class C family)